MCNADSYFFETAPRAISAKQRRLDRAISRATGEPAGRIARLGFVPLTTGPAEREPHRRILRHNLN